MDEEEEEEEEEAAGAAQCSICLTTFKDEEKVKVLPDCNHSYHPECVDRWLITHSNCPLCRAFLRVLDDHSDLP
ncbi:zinc finger protein [Macleaya cordata]|uniref:Zinc finger protein n=1 Tax=Macleaya cordata TaxID=56857 RepID=A0A200PX06_MACCD|nr:zinc finger protein [Macleaya cordata]